MSKGQDWYKEYLRSQHWIEMRRKAYDRYGRACSVIGCKIRTLNLHHLSYQFVGEDKEINDLRPLCWLHHWWAHRRLFKFWKRIPLNRKYLTRRYMQIKRFHWRHFRPSDLLNL